MADTIVPLRCVQTGTPVLPRGILEDPEPPASGAILRLPHEILDTIFSYSDSNTLAKVTRACRGLHRSAFLALWKKPILIHHLRAKDFGEESTVYRSQRLLQTLFDNPRVGPCIKDLRIIHEKDDNTLPIEPPPRILPISPCGVTLEPYTVLLKKVTDSRCLDNLRSLSLEGEGSEVFLSYSPRLDRLECLSIEHLDDTSLLLDGESPWWKQSSGLKRLELRQTGMTGSGDKFALGPLLRHCRNTLETFEIYECEWPLKLLERVGLRRLHTLIIDVNGTRDGEGVDDGGVGQVLDFLHRHAATLRRIWLLHMRNLFSPNKPACEYSQAHLCTELFLDESTQEGWVSLCPLIAVFKRLRVFAARDCMGILDSSLAYIVSALSESKHTLRKLLLPIPGPTYVVDLCRNITRHLPELNHLQFSADHLSKNGMEHDASLECWAGGLQGHPCLQYLHIPTPAVTEAPQLRFGWNKCPEPDGPRFKVLKVKTVFASALPQLRRVSIRHKSTQETWNSFETNASVEILWIPVQCPSATWEPVWLSVPDNGDVDVFDEWWEGRLNEAYYAGGGSWGLEDGII